MLDPRETTWVLSVLWPALQVSPGEKIPGWRSNWDKKDEEAVL